ncbi:hypothetical protein HN371_06950 [Candidatus Poribacteria bacterium]|jgi:hypothetical protein|nr:hypothetical protein [Candidatus Poribacteria bacterium]MBT5535779.1 hypothetical protein [Candidatus Poribacteria bacterium]MBT5711808.1 hypothetical protein [Candidatus Poribacteria bacterium]MBT7805235.1 hypothetical protein [Candidatus Poribacteria bacterium]
MKHSAHAGPPENATKAFVVALFCSVIIAFWTQHSELVIDSPSFNSIHPSVAGFFAIIVISLFVNPLLSRLRRRWALSQREMLTIYSIMIVVGPVVSIGGVHFLLGTLIAPYYYATPENEYVELFHRLIPSWFGPKEPEAIRHFYEGSEGAGVPWSLWIRPLVLWSLFLLAVYGLFVCMSVIVRKQWVDREKLTFPLVQLPLEMTRPPAEAQSYNAFFRNPLMWMGFAIPVVIHGVNGTHTYFPQFPEIQYRNINLRGLFTEAPWNKVGRFSLSFYPCIVGFAYILTLDLSFSVGFFYLVQKAQLIVGAATGWSSRGALARFPFVDEQGAGAFIVIALSGFLLAGGHLRDVMRSAAFKAPDVDDSREPLPYRWAVVGYLLCLAFLVGWSLVAGMTLGAALVFFLLFSLFSLSLTRVRVQAGLGAVHGPMTVQDLMMGVGGTQFLGAQNLTVMGHYFFMTGEMRGVMSVMPSHLEGYRLAEHVRINPRKLVVGVMLGTTIGLALAHFAALRTIYDYGGNILNNWRVKDMPARPWKDLRLWLTNPRDVDWVGLQFVGAGALITVALTFLRLKFVWWPFHPVGYAAAYTGRTIHWFWFTLLLGCALKYMALKHGGPKTYRAFLPFFLGLILGDFFMGGLWGVFGLASSQPGYLFFP